MKLCPSGPQDRHVAPGLKPQRRNRVAAGCSGTREQGIGGHVEVLQDTAAQEEQRRHGIPKDPQFVANFLLNI